MRIVWDEPKRTANIAKHGFDFAEIDIDFFEGATIYPAQGGRHIAIGEYNGAIVTLVFTMLGSEAISVISMRPSSRKEKASR